MNNGDKPVASLVAALENEHQTVMDIEAEALRLLAANDVDGYREKMRAKAERLAELEGTCRPFLAGLPENDKYDILNALGRFAASAATALKLNSVFYMSALLYPDEHKKGEPDNLELFIAALKAGKDN